MRYVKDSCCKKKRSGPEVSYSSLEESTENPHTETFKFKESTSVRRLRRRLGLFILGGKDFIQDYKEDIYTRVICDRL